MDEEPSPWLAARHARLVAALAADGLIWDGKRGRLWLSQPPGPPEPSPDGLAAEHAQLLRVLIRAGNRPDLERMGLNPADLSRSG